MVEQRYVPPSAEMDEEVLKKLDGGLRRLLRMTEDEIIEAVDSQRSRRAEQMERIEQLKQILPPTASDEDRQAVRRIQKLYRDRLLAHPVFGAVIIDRFKPVLVKSRAIVHFTGNRDDLIALGLDVRGQAHDIFTVVGTPKQLATLAAEPATLRLRLPRILLPDVENAAAQGEVSAVHQPRPANPSGFQGDGVIVGVIDSALDVTHHGFRDPVATPAGDHETRVLYYWVQSPYILDAFGNPISQANPPGQTPKQFYDADTAHRPNFSPFDYGRLYTEDDINTALGLAGGPYGTGANQICCEPGTEEHGTHVAGIAVGSGHVSNWNTAPTHVGAAPQAALIHVGLQLLQGDLDTGGTFEDALLDAIDFCMRAADFHNMPIVVSVSQGSSFGPHNGSSSFDLARDNLLNSFDSRSIVWSAGNDNNDNGYRRGNVAAASTDTFTLTARRNMPMWLDVWYTGPELDYRVTFGGSSSGWRTAGQDYQGTLSSRDIEVERDIEPGGALHGIRLYIDGALVGEAYTIDLRNPHASGSVDYHAWSGLQGWWADLSGSSQDELTLSDTGCGQSILTVGACSKRHPANPASGETITAYSGAGPTVDGRVKPEIVAVGGALGDSIVSANSNQASGYTTKHGTSMSTPFVAGAVALLFDEYDTLGHDLNQDTIKALLMQHANRLNLHLDPAQPGYVAVERNRYGHGRLRLIAPIDHIRPPVNVDLWVRTAADDYGPEPYIGGCFCGAPDIKVFEAGTNSETTRLTWGTTYDVRVTVRNLGNDDAVGATLRLKYTLPWTAPNAWVAAEDASNQALQQTVTVPALDQVEATFHWRPERGEISGAPAGATHFCLLAEVDHAIDPLVYSAPTTSGGSAWATNIKGTNNVALRNLHIQ